MIKEAISSLVAARSLTEDEAAGVMEEIMNSEVSPAQFGTFVTALRYKGETVDEITGMARTMRTKAIPVMPGAAVVDTCGTGGDNSSTFNISTATAIVTAAAGLKVAKHGNRAMSSQCGSADVLEALGIRIELTAGQVQRSIEETGFGFMYAPLFHPAMKFAAGLRREIGIRTVFNILGPLTNPAGAGAQVVGVPNEKLVEKIAMVLQRLGCKRALVVHGEDGLDEITVTGKTRICELQGGTIRNYSIHPGDFGIETANIDGLKSADLEESVTILRSVLSGQSGAPRDAVLLNTAGVLLVGGQATTLKEGIEIAVRVIDSGQAFVKLQQIIEFSQGLN